MRTATEIHNAYESIIFTVFPNDTYYLPQDFETYTEALEYLQELPCDGKIEYTEGNIV